MTFYPIDTRARTTLIPSVLKAGTTTGVSVGDRWSISGTVNGSASIVDNRLNLVSGSSYYLEGSVLVRNTSANGLLVWQWYNASNSSWVGSEGYMNLQTSYAATARVSRRVASAFIPDSSISTFLNLELRIKTITGSNWSFTVDAGGISGYTFVGYPSIRLLELPT